MIALLDSTTLGAMSKDSVSFFARRWMRRGAALLPLFCGGCHLLRPATTPMACALLEKLTCGAVPATADLERATDVEVSAVCSPHSVGCEEGNQAWQVVLCQV